MSGFTLKDINYSQTLTDIGVAFMNKTDQFVAAKIFPNIPVDIATPEYYEFDSSFFLSAESVPTAEKNSAPRTDYGITKKSISVKYHDLAHEISFRVLANPRMATMAREGGTRIVVQGLLRGRERALATAAFADASWDSLQTGVAGTPSTNQFKVWSDYTASKPIQDIRAGQTFVQGKTGLRPNTLVLSRDVYDKLCDHPDFVERVKYGQTPGEPAMVSDPSMAKIFGLDNVFILDAVKNTAKEGLTATTDFMIKGYALLIYVNPTPSLFEPSAGYLFTLPNYYDQTGAQEVADTGVAVGSYDIRDRKVEVIEGNLAYDLKIVAKSLGYLFKSAIA